MATPAQVAEHGLRALEAGELTTVHGLSNRLMVALPRLMPRATIARLTHSRLRPQTALAQQR